MYKVWLLFDPRRTLVALSKLGLTKLYSPSTGTP